MVCFCVTTKAYHTRAVLSTPFSRKLSLYVFWRILAHRLRKLSLECIKTIPRLEGATPWPSFPALLVGRRLAVGALPPARLRAVRRAPRRLPRAPAVRRSAGASAVCSRLSAPPRGPALVAVPRSGLRPAPRPVGPWCASPAAPPPPLASACRRLRSPVARVRAAPRWPRRSPAGSPSARSARGWPRASLRSGLALVLSPRLARRVPPRGPPPAAAASPSLLPRGGAGLRPVPPPPRATATGTCAAAPDPGAFGLTGCRPWRRSLSRFRRRG